MISCIWPKQKEVPHLISSIYNSASFHERVGNLQQHLLSIWFLLLPARAVSKSISSLFPLPDPPSNPHITDRRSALLPSYRSPSQTSSPWLALTVCRGLGRGKRALLRMLLQPQRCLSHLVIPGQREREGRGWQSPGLCLFTECSSIQAIHFHSQWKSQ